MPQKNPYKDSEIGPQDDYYSQSETLYSNNNYNTSTYGNNVSHDYSSTGKRYIVLILIFFVVFAAAVLTLSYFSSRVLKMDFMYWPRNVWDAAFVKWYQVDIVKTESIGTFFLQMFQSAWFFLKCVAWGISFVVLMIVGFLGYVLMFVALPLIAYFIVGLIGYGILHVILQLSTIYDEDLCIGIFSILMVLEFITMYLFLLL